MPTDDLLKIPDFLRRGPAKPGPQKTRRRGRTRRIKAFVIKRPSGKKWKRAIFLNVHLNLQAPRIGSGQRRVFAIVGWKWVYLADGHGRVAKITREEFDIIKK